MLADSIGGASPSVVTNPTGCGTIRLPVSWQRVWSVRVSTPMFITQPPPRQRLIDRHGRGEHRLMLAGATRTPASA